MHPLNPQSLSVQGFASFSPHSQSRSCFSASWSLGYSSPRSLFPPLFLHLLPSFPPPISDRVYHLKQPRPPAKGAANQRPINPGSTIWKSGVYSTTLRLSLHPVSLPSQIIPFRVFIPSTSSCPPSFGSATAATLRPTSLSDGPERPLSLPFLFPLSALSSSADFSFAL